MCTSRHYQRLLPPATRTFPLWPYFQYRRLHNVVRRLEIDTSADEPDEPHVRHDPAPVRQTGNGLLHLLNDDVVVHRLCVTTGDVWLSHTGSLRVHSFRVLTGTMRICKVNPARLYGFAEDVHRLRGVSLVDA